MSYILSEESKMKKATKAILFSLAGTALGMIGSAIVKAFLNQKIFKQAALKDLLKELYPEQEWEHQSIFSTPLKITYTAYATDDFITAHPDAEARLIEAAHERTPALAKIKCDIMIRPMSEFEAKIHKKCCCCGDEDSEAKPVKEEVVSDPE